LRENGIPPGRFFVICGDRHWKYHSVHPSGYEEFCSGTLNRENARGGRAPGNPGSTDPHAQIRQPYKDKGPSGGSRIEFSHYDDTGAVLYRHVQTAP
jgi:alkaline phosphatase D